MSYATLLRLSGLALLVALLLQVLGFVLHPPSERVWTCSNLPTDPRTSSCSSRGCSRCSA